MMYFAGTIEYLVELGAKSNVPLQYARKSYIKRIGEIIMLLYNTVQVTLEITIIVLVIVINLTFTIDDKECGTMMAHYLFYLSSVNQWVFFCIACLFAKLTKEESEWENIEKPTMFRQLAAFQFPLICWLFVKFKYNIVVAIVTQTILTMMSTITYFYNRIYPGTIGDKIVNCFPQICVIHAFFYL